MKRILFFAIAVAAFGQQPRLDTELKKIFSSDAYKVKTFGPARWLDGGAAYTTVENQEIVRYETATGKREVLISAKQLTAPGAEKPMAVDAYQWSADRKQLLVFTNTRKVWRQNTRGDYWVLDLASGKLTKLGGPQLAASTAEPALLFAKFSPDGKQVAYVRANNIYAEELGSGKIRQLTKDGSATIINGTADWVYEEELGLRDGFRWSPDSNSIAYWHFDTSGVGIFNLINNTADTYPKLVPIAYPKVGTTNSAVTVGVVTVRNGKTKWMAVPGDTRENYLGAMDWAGNRLLLQQLNRLQNQMDLLEADPGSGKVRRILRDEDKAWVDLEEVQPLKAGYLLQSERDGWRRVYLASSDGSTAKPVTPAATDVMQVARVTPGQDWLYYIGAGTNPTQRHLFRVSLATDTEPKAQQLSTTPGTHSYDIAPSGDFAFHTYSTMNVPPTTDLIRLPSHERVRTLAENTFALPGSPTEFGTVDIGGGVVLDTWMMMPKDFDPTKRYPVLIHVYGEPAGVTVTDNWQGSRGLFHRALAEQGYIVVSMDNRGTPAPKGRDWRKVVYGTVGKLSAAEQALGMQALLQRHSFIDPERVGVWGWSGGGSNTLNLMFRSPELYKVGMSVAPVPDQRLYDTIYQERYMGVPKSNAEGYRVGSPINFAEGLRGKLLLVHGTGDDNVHYQGMELLINRLITLGKPFDMYAYPNRSHSINEGPGTSFHLHSQLGRYLLSNLPAGGR